MQSLSIEIEGTRVLRRLPGSGLGDALPAAVGRNDLSVETALRDWAERYGKAVQVNDEPAIRSIGSEMFVWLDQNEGLLDWLADQNERALEVVVRPNQNGALADALLAAPWEALCRDKTFLAEEQSLFTVVRRCGAEEKAIEAHHRDLSLMFMAAAPAGDDTLDFEREEASILAATTRRTDGKPLAQLQVEESGALAFLSERLTFDGPFEALHISCHGNITLDENKLPAPVLMLETAEGKMDLVAPERLMDEIMSTPPLVFLSACRTAESGADPDRPHQDGYRREGSSEGTAPFETAQPAPLGSEDRRDGATFEPAPDLADPYVRQLARRVPNVLGWDGSVYDVDATAFAEGFYGALSRGDTVPVAAARARKEVLRLREQDPRLGRHWHLARVYLGPGGGGRLCDPTAKARKAPPSGETAFLDTDAKLVPVASPSEFVGRRRAIQRVIQAYRDGNRGVVVHGMGNLGKSSLAARVANRMRGHKVVAVFGEATERTIFQALVRAGKQMAADMAFEPGEALLTEIAGREQALAKDPTRFGDMVQALLDRCFDDHPLLLVLDDFEQSLATLSEQDKTVLPAADFAPAMRALLRAFAEADTASRLLITTRYDFAVPDGAGTDLARDLARVPLAPMKDRERVKQVQAKARASEQDAVIAAADDLLQKALRAARGNPGLQDALTKPIFAGESDKAETAIAAIEAFHESGRLPPEDEDVGDFFQRMAFERYTAALGRTERRVLGAATLFTEALPVPRAAVAAAATARAVADPEPAIDRLLALGLLDDYGPMSGWSSMEPVPHLAANPLARPLGEALTEAERPSLAASTLVPLAVAWRDDENDFPHDPRGLEAAMLALQAEPGAADLLNQAAQAAVIFLYDREQNARGALALGQAVLARLEALSTAPDPIFAGKLVNAAGILGEVAMQEQLINATLKRDDLSDLDRGQYLGLRGSLEHARGDNDIAEATQNEALKIFERIESKREIAITKGHIADILYQRGDLDGTLTIRETEQLPIYEALGDRRSIAITKGKIADILYQRGDLDGALTIRETEELPVYEALGDRRSIAMTKGQIADILYQRGDPDGALVMHGERLDVAREMQDVDSIAHIQFNRAQIRLAHGEHEGPGIQTAFEELDEAFRAALQTLRPDFIGPIGALLGQILAAAGQRTTARKVLQISATAFAKVGAMDQAAQVQQVLDQIGEEPS